MGKKWHPKAWHHHSPGAERKVTSSLQPKGWHGGALPLDPTEGGGPGALQESRHGATSHSQQRSSEPCPEQPDRPPPARPRPRCDSPSESMLFKAVGGMMDTLYWPRGHLLPKSSLQAL